MKIGEAELAGILSKPGYGISGETSRRASSAPASPQLSGVKATAASRYPQDRMNKTEARYLDECILPRVKAGEIRSWRFDEMRFYIGPNCWYKPDFVLVLADGRIEIHETKGAWIEEDGRIKFKVAAERFPEFTWELWQWSDKRWARLQRL